VADGLELDADDRSLDGEVYGIAAGTLLGADEGVVDGLELDANDGSLDGEVDGRALKILLVADEGVVDGLEVYSDDGHLMENYMEELFIHYWVQMRVWWMGLKLMLMIGHLIEK